MDTNKGAANGAEKQQPTLFGQPRKMASGIVYSGAIAGMLLISLAYSVTIAVLAQTLDTTTSALLGSEACRYISYLLYDVVYIAVIAVFVRVYKERPRDFGFRKTKARYLLLAVPLAFGVLFSLNWVNGLFAEFLQNIGYEASSGELPSLAGAGIVGVLFAVALLPAFFEETILRGIVLEGIKDCGTVAACLLSGLLFAVFHMNPVQTIYQFICGCLFALLAIRSGSVFPSMIAHFLNNAVIVLDARLGFISGLAGGPYIALVAVSAAVLVAVLVYLIFFDRAGNRKKEGAIKPFLFPALVGLIVGGITWIGNLIAGFGG